MALYSAFARHCVSFRLSAGAGRPSTPFSLELPSKRFFGVCRPWNGSCYAFESRCNQKGVVCVDHVRWDSSTASARKVKRMQKLGIGPDGKPLPIPNVKKIFPRMYKVLVVNQDGSTYHIRHNTPHQIITLPLDLATLTEEEREARRRRKQIEAARVYEEEEIDEEEREWSHSQYQHLIREK